MVIWPFRDRLSFGKQILQTGPRDTYQPLDFLADPSQKPATSWRGPSLRVSTLSLPAIALLGARPLGSAQAAQKCPFASTLGTTSPQAGRKELLSRRRQELLVPNSLRWGWAQGLLRGI